MLRTTTEFAPAPSSGGNLSELASLMENRSSQYHQSKASTVNREKRNSYSVGRNTQSVLSPLASPSIMRSISIDSDTVLPIANIKHDNNDQAPQKPRRATTLRAAETGKGSLLPLRGTPAASTLRPQQQPLPQRVQRKAPARSNSSGPSYSGALPRTRQDLGDTKSHPQKFLRQRNRNASSDDEFDSSSQRIRRNFSGSRRQRQGSGMSVSSMGSIGGTNNGGSSKEHASSLGWGNGILCERQLIKLSRMKLGHLLQVVIVLAVIALVYESHHKALYATEKLIQFKEEESLLLLHLSKIEQQNTILHQNFVRLAETSAETSGDIGGGAKREEKGVDTDLLHRQIEQLQNMEKEIDKEVQTLQRRIQRSARSHIIQEFGEGPVQVVLELDFGSAAANAGSNRISILLWHDTPHASWTWLEQIGNNVWDGAAFKWQEGHIIDALPAKEKMDPKRDGKIEFIERPKQDEHMPWTVGLREHGSHGAMSMYINLQNNSQLHRHETCVGKVIDGFDTLQNLLELSKNNGSSTLPISIRKATAEHYVTKKAGMK